jgi:hypothetical protein
LQDKPFFSAKLGKFGLEPLPAPRRPHWRRGVTFHLKEFIFILFIVAFVQPLGQRRGVTPAP